MKLAKIDKNQKILLANVNIDRKALYKYNFFRLMRKRLF